MADTKGSLFPTLLGTALTNTDRVHIIDTSDTTTQPAGPGGANKTMLVSEFIAGINSLGGGAFVKAGISGGQTAVGGTAATDDLILKPTSSGAPASGARVDIMGGNPAIATFRADVSPGFALPAAWQSGTTYTLGQSATDVGISYTCYSTNSGNNTLAPHLDAAHWDNTYGPAGNGVGRPQLIMGDNSAGNGSANQMMTIMSGTPATNPQRTLAKGGGVLIVGGDDYAGYFSNRALLHVDFNNVAGSPDSTECHAGIFTTWGNNPGYGATQAGCLSALTARTWDMSNRSRGSTFGGNFTANVGVGSDFSGAAEPGITNRTTLVALEVDANDHCVTEGINIGTALRVTTNGTWDVMCGINLNTGATPGGFRNSILASTNPRAFATAAYGSGGTYQVGEVVTVASSHYMCKIAHGPGVPGQTTPRPPPNNTYWKLLQDANGPIDNLIYYGLTAANAPTGTPLFQVAAGVGDVTTSGFVELVNRAIAAGGTGDPGNPPSGHAYMWFNGTNLLWRKNVGGTLSGGSVF